MMGGFCHFFYSLRQINLYPNYMFITQITSQFYLTESDPARLIHIRTVDRCACASVRRDQALQAIRHKKCTFMLQLYLSTQILA
jgi:hypothetical protein